MDFIELNQWITFFIGIGVALATAYGTMKAQGKIAYPVAWVEAGKAQIAADGEKIKDLTVGCEIAQYAVKVTNHISAQELDEILMAARKYGADGLTAQEAQDLGLKLVEAAKTQIKKC